MHTSKIQKSTSSNSHTSKPFFNIGGEAKFFSKTTDSQNSFFSSNPIQAKLTIGQPGDKYEQEADMMADRVVQKLENPKTLQPIQRKCVACEQEEKLQKKEMGLMRKPIFESNEESRIQTKSLEGRLNTPTVQAKLTIGAADDPYEREADAVADKVMRMPVSGAQEKYQGEVPSIQSKSLIVSPIQRMCSECEKEQNSGIPVIQKKPNHSFGSGHSSAPDSVMSTIKSPGSGSPLSESVRSRVEPVLGADLSGVSVHTDGAAQKAAEDIGARAFTNKSNIYLGAGQNKNDVGLMAHEATHVVQQGGASYVSSKLVKEKGSKVSGTVELIQRNTEGNDTSVASSNVSLKPRAGSQQVWFQGVQLSDDTAFMRGELHGLIARRGLWGADLWYAVLTGKRSTVNLPFSAHARAFGGLRVRSPIDTMREMPRKLKQRRLAHIIPLVTRLYADVRSKAIEFIQLFEEKAKENLLTVLEAHETQAKAEGIRYGITSKTIEKIRYRKDDVGGMSKEVEFETQYKMNRDSFATKGLQGAAKVLLQRRQALKKQQKEQRKHVKWERDPYDRKGRILVPTVQYHTIGNEIDEKKKEYSQLRDYLSVEYPALAVFSDISKGINDLKQIAKKGASPDNAALIGEEIAKRITKIAKVRRGLKSGDVNVWRLPKIIDVTAAQMGMKADRMMARLVKDKRKTEQPGILDDIALLALNIGAIVLAPVTGGASLAVAAGVNLAVAGVHVKEYLMKEALTGTSFHKAQAISQDEPSLFWLAFEIVGVMIDVGAAAAALAKLARLAKAAQTAKIGNEAEKSLEALRVAAKAKGGTSLAERVVARVKAIRSGESQGTAALKAVGATEKEVKLLGKAGMATEKAATKRIGKVAKGITGDVNVSKSGHIFICTNPCTVLRDKYAQIFAKSDEVSQGFKRDLEFLEAEAQKAAKMRAAGQKAKAEELANSVKQRVINLEGRIVRANPQFLSLDELEKLLRIPEFKKGTAKGYELRYIRYQRTKQGKKLPFSEWQRKTNQIWKNSANGTLTEQELQEAMDLGLKNFVSMNDKTGAKSFIPDHVVGMPDELIPGKPYHFVEIKDWKTMSDTGNLKAMLNYVGNTPGSKITIYFRSTAKMSGPLRDKIEKLRIAGIAELLPFAGR